MKSKDPGPLPRGPLAEPMKTEPQDKEPERRETFEDAARRIYKQLEARRARRAQPDDHMKQTPLGGGITLLESERKMSRPTRDQRIRKIDEEMEEAKKRLRDLGKKRMQCLGATPDDSTMEFPKPNKTPKPSREIDKKPAGELTMEELITLTAEYSTRVHQAGREAGEKMALKMLNIEENQRELKEAQDRDRTKWEQETEALIRNRLAHGKTVAELKKNYRETFDLIKADIATLTNSLGALETKQMNDRANDREAIRDLIMTGASRKPSKLFRFVVITSLAYIAINMFLKAFHQIGAF